MRKLIAIAIASSLILALLALVSRTEPREDDLSRSIERLLESRR